MSIIIVEGPDGSGKTTLLRNLRANSKTYFWIASSSSRPKTVLDLHDALHWIGQAAYLRVPIVCDRFPVISESIYGPLFRGASLLDQLDRRDKMHATELLSEADRIIYCRPPLDSIASNLISHPQMAGVRERYREIVGRYDDFIESLRETGVRVIDYDFTKAALPGRTIDFDQLFFGK